MAAQRSTAAQRNETALRNRTALRNETAQRNQRGAMALWVAVVLPAFILLVGLGVDLAGYASAQQQARAVAADAARSAGQYLILVSGKRAQPELKRAKQAAESYLAAAGYSGEVRLSPTGEVRLKVAGKYQTLFLGMIGINTLPLNATAAARPALVLAGHEN